MFSITSILKEVPNVPISIQTSDWIQFTPFAYKAIFENEFCPEMTSIHELPPSGIYCIRNVSRAPKEGICIDLLPFPHKLTSLNQQQCPPEHVEGESIETEQQLAADHLLSALKASVWRRLATIDRDTSSPHICVMFSGGIDCSILVCLICLLLREHGWKWTIELASIAFGEDVEEKERVSPHLLVDQIPDRYTGCM